MAAMITQCVRLQGWSNGFGACHKQQYLAYSTRQLCVRQFGDQASYRQASFLTCLHAIAFVAFPMFITFYEVYTSVIVKDVMTLVACKNVNSLLRECIDFQQKCVGDAGSGTC